MDRCSGITVENTGAFVMKFFVRGPNGQTSPQAEFPVGQFQTTQRIGWVGFAKGDEMWPVADVVMGAEHEAGDNVIWDPDSPNIARYTCGGTSQFPSFTYCGI